MPGVLGSQRGFKDDIAGRCREHGISYASEFPYIANAEFYDK